MSEGNRKPDAPKADGEPPLETTESEDIIAAAAEIEPEVYDDTLSSTKRASPDVTP
jgi:hypothetical protein